MTKKKELIANNQLFYCVPTRELVVFPNMIMHFDVGRAASVKAVKAAMNASEPVFLVPQKDVNVERPAKSDLYQYGTLAKVKQIIKTPGGIYRCLVEGVRKAKLLSLHDQGAFYSAEIKLLPNYGREKLPEANLEAVMRELKKVFNEYADLMPRMPDELYKQVESAHDAVSLFEAIAFNIMIEFDFRRELLELSSPGEKLTMLLTVLTREIEVMTFEQKIHERVHENLDRNQREFYIREQIRVLRGELGELNADEPDDDEMEQLTNKIKELAISEESREKLLTDVSRLKRMAPSSPDASVLRNYLETVTALPWNNTSEDNNDIKAAKKILEEDHYGMKRVKERVLENLAVMQMTGSPKGQILCLYGPPGVGKTSVGKSIARALGRKYVRVSLGGVRDESDVRGHRKTYIGAMPGRIMTALSQAGTRNPVMLLDEIDKISRDLRGDPSSALLEVLDPEQNTAFTDHYIEVPFDLSEVLFVTTANDLSTIDPPLLDRMEVIELQSYTREEKFNIAKLHLIPKQLEKHGLKASQLRINNDAVYAMIDNYTKEAGVRKLERSIASLCRKAARQILEGEAKRVTVSAANIYDFLGHKKYLDEGVSKEDEIGLVNGLAWTSVGGVIMPLEVLVLDGKGKTEFTGSLGDVMKESAKIAVSLCRRLADKYGIDPSFYENKDLHIHAPEGAVPKDGPSAGVTMTTALISALSGIPVRHDVAMTGEITLRGKVLPIGGLREKTMAAYKAGMNTVIIPKENQGDLDEVDDAVKLALNFVFADTIGDVLDTALVRPHGKHKAEVPFELVNKPVRRARKNAAK
ncbi:MAG: endopeptidase La [Ruminococcus sp.]|nr:endopeptidase La [Ruminococcus sp.]